MATVTVLFLAAVWGFWHLLLWVGGTRTRVRELERELEQERARRVTE
jgi:hypothetical protein